ncbi:hypothetical protein MTO96_037345 [Rhipicephalus appendiculatus]
MRRFLLISIHLAVRAFGPRLEKPVIPEPLRESKKQNRDRWGALVDRRRLPLVVCRSRADDAGLRADDDPFLADDECQHSQTTLSDTSIRALAQSLFETCRSRF